jgi:ATP-dependent helicase/nuclease subunit B
MRPERSVCESASAEQRLQRAAGFLRSIDARSGALIIAPSPGAALWVMARVLDPGQARLGWYRRTLDTLAMELALPELAENDLAPVRGIGAEALCARVVYELGEQGQLGRYATLRQRPGLAHALASTIGELRLAGTESELVAAHDPDLGRLLGHYAAALAEARLADRATVLRAATRAAQRGGHPSAGRPLLALDVLLRHAVEAEFAAALCANRAAVCVVQPAGAEQSLRRWRAALPADRTGGRIPAEPAELAASDLTRLQTHMFSPSVGDRAAPGQQRSVRFVSSPGESREAVEVARGLLAAAADGVPFDAMAVVVRSVENYRSVLEEALARAQIPAHFADGVRRPAPEGRALLALLRCAREGLSARTFAEYLSLGVAPVQAGTSERDADPINPRHWERLLIDAAVVGGRARWTRRLAGRARALGSERAALDPDDPRRGSLGRQIDQLAALSRFASPLLDALGALPEGKSWGNWLPALDALARMALRTPSPVCELLAELAPLGPLGPVSIHEVCRVLGRRLGNVITRSTGSGAGKVFVGSVDDALGRGFDRVFVMGLSEKVFPPRIDADPLLPDPVRARIDAELCLTEDRVSRERLAMRLAIGAAREQLVLSFPRFDVEHNRARVPSFYGLEALRAIDGVLPAWGELSRRADPGAAARMGWPAPELPQQAIDDAEYDLSMLARFCSGGGAPAGSARYFLLSNPHLARSLRFRARRWSVQRFLSADGLVLEDEAGRSLLRPHALSERAYSATALAQFAACPYKFYLHAIAGVSAREEMIEVDELDARQRGVLFHAVQRAVLSDLQQRGWIPLEPDRLEAACHVLEATFASIAARAREEYAPAIERVFDAALAATRADLQQWLDRLCGESSWFPLHMELGFGLDRGELDPSSPREPARLEVGLLLRGAIDLVERRIEQDAGGRIQMRATDHKTGAPPERLGTISGGRVLQPALYALALERIFPEAHVSGGRLYFCTSRAGFISHEVPLDERTRAACANLTGAISEMLDDGFLPAAPAEGECERCAYQVVCGPYEEERVGRIKARDIARIDPVRRLRMQP